MKLITGPLYYLLTPEELVDMKDKFINTGVRAWHVKKWDDFDFFVKDIFIKDNILYIQEVMENCGDFKMPLGKKHLEIRMDAEKNGVYVFDTKKNVVRLQLYFKNAKKGER